MLLSAKQSHLLVVDLQERLVPAIYDGGQVIKNVSILLRSGTRLGVPVTVTEQYPKGLGPTLSGVVDDLPAEAVVFPKTSFSAAGDAATAERVAMLREKGFTQLVICGAEAHVCVLQSALGFKGAGLDVFVVADAVSSRSSHSIDAACARLLHAGCHWVTTEMVAFEWLEKAATEDFRALSPLFK